MTEVDSYLDGCGTKERLELERIRKAIWQIVPEATEVITYGMPGFTYNGKYLIAYASFKDHLSVFPGSSAVDTNKSELTAYKTS